MIILSKSALKYAVDICKERNNYRIIIFTYSEHRAEKLCQKLESLYKDYNCLKINSVSGGFKIVFNNDSIIRILTCVDFFKGSRAHTVIVDDLIDRNMLNRVILPCESLNNYDCYNRLKEGDI